MRAIFFFSFAALVVFAEPSNRGPQVVVMLDVNDTMLREVDQAYAGRPGVQTVVYKPTPGRRQSSAGVPHLKELDGGRLETTLGLRPGMEPFFERLFPLVAEGKVRIVLTSLGDPQRTRAIAAQVKVGGKALLDWGVETLPPEEFHEAFDLKEVGKFRRALRLPGYTKVLAVDDQQSTIFDTTGRDAVFEVPPWTVAIADSHYDGLAVPNLEKHAKVFDSVADRVVAMVAISEKSGSSKCDWSALVVPP